MLIISFAKTVPELLDGKKDVTRRLWKASHAKQFYPGRTAMAYDKSPRFHGKHIATIQITSIRLESLSRMLDDPKYGQRELAREGGRWPTVAAFIQAFNVDPATHVYRVEFRLITLRWSGVPSHSKIRETPHRRKYANT